MTDYEFTTNVHSSAGALVAARRIFGEDVPESLLDVGCGGGTWLHAAQALGIADLVGVDGQSLSQHREIACDVLIHDLTKPFDLQRKFDLVLCLEVAEHLPETSAATLVESLCRHGDHIVFSAACPAQHGQHHVNCQWPTYWQALFNAEGFECADAIRWDLWHESKVEPWYRQNLFTARRSPSQAGKEPRLSAVIHPDMIEFLHLLDREEVERGAQPLGWYFRALVTAAIARAKRFVPDRLKHSND
jgi:SAM-dependent methyltransferase